MLVGPSELGKIGFGEQENFEILSISYYSDIILQLFLYGG